MNAIRRTLIAAAALVSVAGPVAVAVPAHAAPGQAVSSAEASQRDELWEYYGDYIDVYECLDTGEAGRQAGHWGSYDCTYIDDKGLFELWVCVQGCGAPMDRDARVHRGTGVPNPA